MKLHINRKDFFEILSVVSRGLSSRSTLPILSGVLVTARTDEGSVGTVTLNSTDLEVAIKCTTTTEVEYDGSIVIPGKLLFDIVRSLPEAYVTLSSEGENALLSCGQSSFSLKALRVDDFPRFPEIAVDKKISLPSNLLSDIVGHVSKAVSKDETRPVLTGILITLDGSTLRMVATDSYRLAVKEAILNEPINEQLEVIVSGKTLEEVTRLSINTEIVSIGVSDNQMVFEIGETIFVTRRIDGSFPNYKQLIPKETETQITVSRDDLINAIKRVSLLAQHNAPVRLSVSAEDETVSLTTKTQDVGDASEVLMAKVQGPDVEIAFNPAFLSDGIAAAKGDSITIDIMSPLKPGVLRSPGDEGFMYLLMPVRLS